jgi:hypothetical protein
MSGNDAIEVAVLGWDLTPEGKALAQEAAMHALV